MRGYRQVLGRHDERVQAGVRHDERIQAGVNLDMMRGYRQVL